MYALRQLRAKKLDKIAREQFNKDRFLDTVLSQKKIIWEKMIVELLDELDMAAKKERYDLSVFLKTKHAKTELVAVLQYYSMLVLAKATEESKLINLAKMVRFRIVPKNISSNLKPFYAKGKLKTLTVNLRGCVTENYKRSIIDLVRNRIKQEKLKEKASLPRNKSLLSTPGLEDDPEKKEDVEYLKENLPPTVNEHEDDIMTILDDRKFDKIKAKLEKELKKYEIEEIEEE